MDLCDGESYGSSGPAVLAGENFSVGYMHLSFNQISAIPTDTIDLYSFILLPLALN